ncbi:MAG: hypothetical protein IPH34_08805 [Chitinophagaceae bacterium]|nr:hypothetical protein [Chitinophagaceae bacterium]
MKALYQNSDGVARTSTYGEMMDGKPGQLFSNRFFFNLDLSGLHKKLNITDVLLQEVCEYLELNNHIEAATKTDKGIFEKIRFTAAGVTAYKTNHYLKENKRITDDKWIRRSTLINNWTTPFIALAALIVAIISLANECNGKSDCKSPDLTQTGQVGKEQSTSEGQNEKKVSHLPQTTNSNDTIPQRQKTDSLTDKTEVTYGNIKI